MRSPFFSLVCAALFLAIRALQADPSSAQLRETAGRLGLSSGLILVAGDPGGAQALEFSKALPSWAVLSVPGDLAAAELAREQIAKSSGPGQIVVAPFVGKELPVGRHSVGILVVDADVLGAGAPTDDEVRRVLRPEGSAWIKRGGTWTTFQQPWPNNLGESGTFFVTPGNTNVSEDTEIREPRAIRWNTGQGNMFGKEGAGVFGVGLRIAGGVVCTTRADVYSATPTYMMVAYDAFTGMPLWERPDLFTKHRELFCMDDQRVVFLPSAGKKGAANHLVAVDSKTGKDLVTYTNGPDFSKIDKSFGPMASLHDGKLVVSSRDALHVLDAASGALLWKKEFPGKVVGWPSVWANRVACTVGSNSATSVEVFYNCEKVEAFDLETGKELWTYSQPLQPVENVWAVGLSCRPEEILLNLQVTPSGQGVKQRGRKNTMIRLDPETGKEIWQATYDVDGNRPIFRPISLGDFVFDTVSMRHVVLDAATGNLVVQPGAKPIYSNNSTGCAPYRGARSGYLFRSLYTYRVADHQLKAGRSMAAYCQIGSFPAHGMLFCGSTGCSCVLYIQGMSAFASDPAPGPFVGERTMRGTSSPGKAHQPVGAWPMTFKDEHRSSWTDTEPPAQLKQAWSVPVGGTKWPDGLLGEEWKYHHPTAFPVSGPTAHAGIVTVAASHEHAVIGLDPSTGREKWRFVADARVDSAPSLSEGLAVFGSRGGWVYALNADTGELVWKYLAAPALRYRVQSGQAESLWPLHGTVAISDGKVYAVAGFHSQHDGGFRWAELDLITGKELRSGIWTGESPWVGQKNKQSPLLDVEADTRFLSKDAQSYDNQDWELFVAAPEATLNPVVISQDGSKAVMAAFALDRKTGTNLVWGKDFLRFAGSHHSGFSQEPEFPDFVQPMDMGLLNPPQAGAGYLGIKAKAIAYRGDELVALRGSNPTIGTFGGERHLVGRYRRSDLWADTKRKVFPTAAKPIWSVEGDVKRLGTDGLGRHLAPRRNLKTALPSAVVKAGSQVLVADGKELIRFSFEDGKEIDRLPLPDIAVEAGIAVIDGMVLVSTVDGKVTAFR